MGQLNKAVESKPQDDINVIDNKMNKGETS